MLASTVSAATSLAKFLTHPFTFKAVDHKIQVLEVSGSNVTSVAEHVVMSILLLVRNFVPAHEMVERGDWDVSEIARNAFDLEGKTVGTIGAGRIGYRVLQRLKPFDCKELLYYDYNSLPEGKFNGYEGSRCCDLIFFFFVCVAAAAAVGAKRVLDLKVNSSARTRHSITHIKSPGIRLQV